MVYREQLQAVQLSFPGWFSFYYMSIMQNLVKYLWWHSNTLKLSSVIINALLKNKVTLDTFLELHGDLPE